MHPWSSTEAGKWYFIVPWQGNSLHQWPHSDHPGRLKRTAVQKWYFIIPVVQTALDERSATAGECSLLTMHLLWLNSARWCLPHMCCDHIFCGQDLPLCPSPISCESCKWSRGSMPAEAYCCGSWDCWVTAEYWGFLQVKNKFVILFSLLLVLHVAACFHVVAGCVVLHHGSEYIWSRCSWSTEQLATSCDLNGAGELKGGVL